MLTWLIVLATGIGLLLVSTNYLVTSSQLLAAKWRVSPLIVGTLVVALVTSLPELTVSIVAALKHDTQLAMGNIIGSNIINILLVFPAGILAGKLRVGTTKTQKSSLFLFVVVVAYAIMAQTRVPSHSLGLILLGLTLVYVLTEYFWAVNGRRQEDFKAVKKLSSIHAAWNPVKFILTTFGILSGGILVVTSVENIAATTGLSTGFLGLTLAALATSLPELFISIFSQKHHLAKETLGDVIGSNSYNLLLIGGLVLLISNPAVSRPAELMWLFGSTVVFLIIIRYYQGRVIPKSVALGLLSLCLLYVVSVYYL